MIKTCMLAHVRIQSRIEEDDDLNLAIRVCTLRYDYYSFKFNLMQD